MWPVFASFTPQWTAVGEYPVATWNPGWTSSSLGSNRGQTAAGARRQHRPSAGAWPLPLNPLRAPRRERNPGWERSTWRGGSNRRGRSHRWQSQRSCPVSRRGWRSWNGSVCSYKTSIQTCWPNTSTEPCCTGTKMWLSSTNRTVFLSEVNPQQRLKTVNFVWTLGPIKWEFVLHIWRGVWDLVRKKNSLGLKRVVD